MGSSIGRIDTCTLHLLKKVFPGLAMREESIDTFTVNEGGMLHRPSMITVCVIALLSDDAQAWPWQSCDEQWKSAWDACFEEKRDSSYMGSSHPCYPLPRKFQPECSPADSYLKEYPRGRSQYEEKQREHADLAQRRAERLAMVDVREYRYIIQGDQIFITATLSNLHPEKPLRRLDLNCTIILNDAIELFQGGFAATPDLIMGAAAEVPLYVARREAITPGEAILGRSPQEIKMPSISTKGHPVRSLSVNCQKTAASFVSHEPAPSGYTLDDLDFSTLKLSP